MKIVSHAFFQYNNLSNIFCCYGNATTKTKCFTTNQKIFCQLFWLLEIKTLLDQVIHKVPALGNCEMNANLIHLEYITLATQNFICKSIINSSMLYILFSAHNKFENR